MKSQSAPKSYFRFTLIAAFCLGLSGLGFVSPNAGFYLPSNLPMDKIPQGFENAVLSSVKLKTGRGYCSAAFISADGYVLTASHCIKDCMIEQGFAQLEQNRFPYFDLFKVSNHSPGQPAESSACELVIPEMDLRNPQIVYVGKGYSAFNDSNVFLYSPEQLKEFASFQDDFAILKYSVSKEMNCVSARWTPVEKGEAVWAIGYPQKNQRPEGMGSDGRSEYVSFGTITGGYAENGWAKSEGMSTAEFNILRSAYDLPTLFMSDMDVYPGDSGSMAIDQNGKLIGVNTEVAVAEIDPISNRFFPGIGVSYRLTSIREQVAQNLGDEKVTQIFSCKK